MSTSTAKKTNWGRMFPVLMIAFLVPVFIMIGVFAAKEIYPFGEQCFLRTDLYHQYAMFFSEFQDKLKNGGSLMMSWDIGAGTNFVALYGYYLASPFNWLTVLVAKEYLIEWISILVLLKIGLCSTSFTWYLHKKFDSDSLTLPMFGFAYALSAYMAAYSWNIMWLDCLVLAPIILYGLECLVLEDRCLLYCISLALCIFTNYYISIMVCMFLVLYFVVLMFSQPAGFLFQTEPGKKVPPCFVKLFHFALYSLIAGGLAAVILIPEVRALGSTASSNTTFPKTLTNYFSVLEMMARHCINVTTEVGLDHWPNIYSGCAVIFLFPLYMANRAIPTREKIAKGTLLAFLLFSFSYNIPNYVWHGFHYPNSLPCRQSFLYTAVLLAMCAEAFLKVRKMPLKEVGRSFLVSCVFLILCDNLITGDDFKDYTFWLTLLFMALIAFFIYLYRVGRGSRNVLLFLAFCVMITELTINTNETSVTTVNRTSYWKNYDDYQTLIDSMWEDNEVFFRAEKDGTTRRSKDDGAWLLYPSVSVFSSVANSDVTALYKMLGLEASTNAYSTNGMTPVSASLLGIRYIFSTVNDPLKMPYEFYQSSTDLYAYENPNALSIGTVVSKGEWAVMKELPGNPLQVQNHIMQATTGVSDVFVPVPGYQDGTAWVIDVDQTGFLYTYITNTAVDNVTVSIGDSTRNYSHVKRGFIIDLGYCVQGAQIRLTTTDNQTLTAAAYRIDMDRYEQAMTILNVEQWHLNEMTDTHIAGTLTAAEDGYMIVTIPYDKGWTVRVDGEIVECETLREAFFAVPVSSGIHTVTFDYETEGLKLGLFITILSALALLAILLFNRLRYRAWRRKVEKEQQNGMVPLPETEIPEEELDHVITIDELE